MQIQTGIRKIAAASAAITLLLSWLLSASVSAQITLSFTESDVGHFRGLASSVLSSDKVAVATELQSLYFAGEKRKSTGAS